MINHDTLASRLIRRRAELGYTQDELAKLAEIAPAQLSRYEAGVNKPRAKMIAKLAYVLAVPYEWLETGDETNFSIDAPKEKGEVDLCLQFPEHIRDFLQEQSEKSGDSIEQTLAKILNEYYKAHQKDK